MLFRITIGLFAFSISAGALAAPCAGFVDVDSTSSFCPSVAWVKSRSITLGCTDASHYCPNDPVTRLQMAAFMYRLGFQNTFLNGGNAFGMTATLGTTDGQVLDLYSNGRRVLRLDGLMSADTNLIGGASSNSASATSLAQTIAGGSHNTTGASYATVGGGGQNAASSSAATVGGGGNNTASGQGATVAGGSFNAASGGLATIPGGDHNTASGSYSIAMGYYANADGNGCFVFADSSSPIRTNCNSPNVFVARAINGFYLYTAGTEPSYTGTYLGAGSSSWSTLSDRNSKANIEAVDTAAVLAKLVAIPIATWNWKAQDVRIRHMGPMAQEFHAAFGLGEDDSHITTVDSEGVALAAIQGLYAELKKRDATIADLRERVAKIESLRGELAALRDVIATATAGAAIAAKVDETTTP